MTECVIPAWNYWMVAGLVTATAGIVFIATWTYMQDRYVVLLRQIMDERNSQSTELRNARIINQTFSQMRAVDVANIDEEDI